MKLSDVKVDVQKQEQGAWVSNIPELQGVRLQVRGTNNSDWRKLSARLIDAIPRKDRIGGRISPAQQDALTTRLLVNCGLLGWEGIEDEDGKPLPYSKAKAEELLSDPAYAKFREGVLWACSMVAEQNASDVEDDAGN